MSTASSRTPSLKPETFLDEWNIDAQPHRSIRDSNPVPAGSHLANEGSRAELFVLLPHPRLPGLIRAIRTFLLTAWGSIHDPMVEPDVAVRRPLRYQNRVRPSFFAFKLLSRLTGDRLRVDSSLATVHGFATHDEKYQIVNLLLWNFSASPASVGLLLNNLPKDILVRQLTLDAVAPSDDENARLRPEPPARLKMGNQTMKVDLGQHAVRFWSFE